MTTHRIQHQTSALHSHKQSDEVTDTMKLIWVLFLLCLAVHAVPVPRTGKTKGDAAPQQEVNVLMFGIIQFSQALKYVYETTQAKMEKIDQILLSQEETLQKLGIQTEQAAEVEKQMKEVIVSLQVRKCRGNM